MRCETYGHELSLKENPNSNFFLEKDFLMFLIALYNFNEKIINFTFDNISEDDFTISHCAGLFNTIKKFRETKEPFNSLNLFHFTTDPFEKHLIEDICSIKFSYRKIEDRFLEHLQSIKDNSWIRKREEIRRKIQEGNCSDQEALELAKQFENHKRIRFKNFNDH